MSGSTDPTVIRSIAVSVEDLVTAVETNRTTAQRAVLRMTPPFSGRMRARLHVEGNDEYGPEQPRPVHVDPEVLLADDAPPYPRPAETEDELRNDPTVSYTVERHRDRHAAAVEAWRTHLPETVRDRASIDTPAGTWEVAVLLLGEATALDENGA